MPMYILAELQLDFSSDKITASGWSMQGLNVELALSDDNQLAVNVAASTFVQNALPGQVNGIEFNCPAIQRHEQAYICTGGRLRIADSPYGPQDLAASGQFIDSEHIKLQVEGLKFAGGGAGFELELTEGQWKLALKGKRLKLDSLRKQIDVLPLPKDWNLSGEATLQAKLSGHSDQPDSVKLALQIRNLAYADREGLQVAEGGFLKLNLNARRKHADWLGETKLTLSQGEFYSDPLFLEIAKKPVEMSLQGRWKPVSEQLQIDKSQVIVPQVVTAQGQAILDITKNRLIEANIQLQVDELEGLYTAVLQPFLIGTLMDDLETTGVVNAELALKDGQLQRFNSSMERVSVDDKRSLFALYGLSGQLAWLRDGQSDASHIQIEGGQLYKIDYGPITIHARAQSGEVSFLEPVDIPLMDGFIHIEKLNAQGLLDHSPEWTTSAQLTDISLQVLANSFGWPTMKGQLNGSIPTVHYRNHALKLDGELKFDVFGGAISIGQLVIKDPLGRVPELFADLHLSDLELAQITQTFSFGHIEGGLEGRVEGLHLANWEPIAFRARFNTPENDKTSHRISQRAVDNLTSLGNGVGSGLSSTFLGIFKEFRYNRIELQANLQGSIAELDGMEHSEGGYYLVKGSGLPRIDVIARNRQVAWKTLLERLKNIRVEGMEVR
ncbi:MAG: hypothetical protein KZQ84_16485 [Candidatus Thiodiazotropha sp. (ex Lucinoma borealis)]|nr:hypothetical protein [Candidatus Thiodiazotropha sp. (ex Lucinoma borealis)]